MRPVSVGIVRVGWRYFGLVGGPEPSVHDPEKCKKPTFRAQNLFKVQLLRIPEKNTYVGCSSGLLHPSKLHLRPKRDENA
jgi:hypothetical protein